MNKKAILKPGDLQKRPEKKLKTPVGQTGAIKWR